MQINVRPNVRSLYLSAAASLKPNVADISGGKVGSFGNRSELSFLPS